MSNLRWEVTNLLEGSRPDLYESEGYLYHFTIGFSAQALDDAGGWVAEIYATVPATRTDTEYDLFVDDHQFYDLHAAKLWCESVDLAAYAADLAAESAQQESDAVQYQGED